MTVYCCDSSALVKCYVQEQGSAWMRTLLDPTAGHHLYLASITGVEVIAAVTRRLRRGDIAATDGAATLAQFRQDFAQRYRLIDLTPPLVARAMTLAETHSLRGYDAVQLATAVEVHVRGLTLGLPALTLGDDNDCVELGLRGATNRIAQSTRRSASVATMPTPRASRTTALGKAPVWRLASRTFRSKARHLRTPRF